MKERCPWCDAEVDLALDEDGQKVGLHPGQIVICVFCTQFGQFTQKGFVRLSDASLHALRRTEPVYVAELMDAQAYLKTLDRSTLHH